MVVSPEVVVPETVVVSLAEVVVSVVPAKVVDSLAVVVSTIIKRNINFV